MCCVSCHLGLGLGFRPCPGMMCVEGFAFAFQRYWSCSGPAFSFFFHTGTFRDSDVLEA